jgi:hypothetical protein
MHWYHADGLFKADDSPVHGGSRSWKWQDYNTPTNGNNWVNLGTEANYFSTWIRPDMQGYYEDNSYIHFRNSTGSTIVQLNINGPYLLNNDHEDNEKAFVSYSNNQWSYFSIQMNASDEVYITSKNHFGNWKNFTDTPNTISNDYNFTRIRFISQSAGSGGNCYKYFDDVTVGTIIASSTTEMCGFESITIEGVNDIELGNTNQYNITLTGEAGSQFWFQIKNETN